MKISVRQGRKPLIYGWTKDGAYFLSPFSSAVPERPQNMYAAKEEAEAEAVARGREIVWEDAVDG